MKGVTEITSQREWTQGLSNSQQPVIVDFSAVWCGPCKAIAPHFAQWSQKYTGITFWKVDVDQQQEIASDCGVTAMPTFQLYVKGKKVEEIRGADVKSLTALLEKYNKAATPFAGEGRSLGGDQGQQPTTSTASPASPPQPKPVDLDVRVLHYVLQFFHRIWLQLLALFRPGSSSQPAAAVGAPQEDASGSAPGFDSSKPSTTVQVRLANGTKLTGTFNPSQTVADLRRFLEKQAPSLSASYTMTTSFPPQPLLNDGQTLEQAGVVNSVVNVR